MATAGPAAPPQQQASTRPTDQPTADGCVRRPLRQQTSHFAGPSPTHAPVVPPLRLGAADHLTSHHRDGSLLTSTGLARPGAAELTQRFECSYSVCYLLAHRACVPPACVWALLLQRCAAVGRLSRSGGVAGGGRAAGSCCCCCCRRQPGWRTNTSRRHPLHPPHPYCMGTQGPHSGRA